MCTAIAIALSVLPRQLFDEYDLYPRVFDRGGNNTEIRFAFADPVPLLPVMVGGVLRLVRWGSRDRASRLPPTGWTWRGSVESGAWAGIGCETEPVTILATYGCENNTWFRITEGIHGLLATPPGESQEPPGVYMICEPATRYFKVMTRSERMPSMINELI